MDSHESTAPPPQSQHHPQPPPSSAMFVGQSHPHPQQQQPTNSYAIPNNNNNMSAGTTNAAGPMMQQQQQNPQLFNFNSMVGSNSKPTMDYLDGSSPRASGFAIEPARKKRGRPRKYSPDNNIALGLSPTSVTPVSSSVMPAHADSGGGSGTPSSDLGGKRRGRPPSSGKKQLDALGSAGVGFTPHVITVNAGEDIASKIMAFSQQGPRTVCILSANGAVCNVTLRQPAMSGGTVTYEGRFEIISLSGSYLLSESNGNRSRTGGLSVSLAGSDGRVLGGGVAGMLKAASPVQVVVGSFIADGKKPKSARSPIPSSNMLSFGAPAPGSSPPSDGASSESSDEGGSPPLNHGPGQYANAGQPMQNMAMYTNMAWPKMHPN